MAFTMTEGGDLPITGREAHMLRDVLQHWLTCESAPRMAPDRFYVESILARMVREV